MRRQTFAAFIFILLCSLAFGQGGAVYQQNQVLAGPTSGSGFAAPRLLVTGDLPAGVGAGTVTGGGGNIVPGSGSPTTLYGEQIPLGGRLTFSGASCIFNTDQVAQTALTYGVCGNGKYVPIYDGANMELRTLQPGGDTDAVGYTLTLGSNWAASTINDLYITLSSGTPVLCSVPWTNSTTRATALAVFKGVQTNATGPMTCRTTNSATISVAANQGTLIGWFLTNGSTGQVDFKFGTSASGGGAACICMGNVYNTQPFTATVVDSTTSWTQAASTTWQQANVSAGNQAVVLQGLSGYPVDVTVLSVGNASPASIQAGIGIDSCSVDSSDLSAPNTSGLSAFLPVYAYMSRNLAVGSHTICREQQTGSGTTVTWVGVSGSGNKTGLRVKGYY